MTNTLLGYISCPVNRNTLQLTVLKKSNKQYNHTATEIVEEGLLFGTYPWVYPIIKGVPRLIIEAVYDYKDFLQTHVADYTARVAHIETNFGGLMKHVVNKNSHTKKSFAQEWGLFNYEEDKVWDADQEGMFNRFIQENDETKDSIKGKLIFDAGCGNGRLNQSIAAHGATIVGMDFSLSIERAFEKNNEPNALFIQGDIQFPPLQLQAFDIVHSSGVLICTNNSELSFSCIETCVKPGGKISVWLYHPVKGFIHNLFNFLRNYTSKLPVKFQYYLYKFTLLPLSFIVKRAKGNKQNTREMMIDILDWFSPEFRWEHEHDEAASWYSKRNYKNVKITTNELFGFNIIGEKA